MSMSHTPEEKIAWVYRLQLAKVIAKGLVALIVLCFVARPIAETAKTRIFPELATVLGERPADASAETSLPTPTAVKARNAKHQRTSPEKPAYIAANAAVPRVWAYGIQVSGLVASLGVTLWAIVAVIRSD
jgi:hypothetical protein